MPSVSAGLLMYRRVAGREMRAFCEFYEQGLRELVARWREREERESA